MENSAQSVNVDDHFYQRQQYCQYHPKLIEQFEKSPSWWKKRSILERVFIIIFIAVGLLLSMAVVSFAIKIYISDKAKYETNCTELLYHHTAKFYIAKETSNKTETSRKNVSALLEEMDLKIDPCDDFYKFACGGYIQNANTTAAADNVNKFFTLKENVNKQLRGIIEEIDISNAPKSHKMVKILYDNCVNNSRTEYVANLQFLKKIINDTGGWPVLLGNDWHDNFTWTNSSYRMRKYGYWPNSFFSLQISHNYRNTTKRMLFLGEPTYGFDKINLLKGYHEELLRKYYNYMVEIAVAFGANETLAKVELSESLTFEIKLASLTASLKDEGYYMVKLSQMIKAFPKYPWIQYINEYLAPTTKIRDDEMVLIKAPLFFSRLEVLLRKTPTRVQANYAMWRLVHSLVPYVSKDFRTAFLELRSEVEGLPRASTFFYECIDLLSDKAQTAISALYVQKYVNPKIKDRISDLIAIIRIEFLKILAKIDWMDPYTKKNAIKKAMAMTSHIAYPDELRDYRKIDDYYLGLKINSTKGGNFLQNIVNLKRFNMEQEIALLRKYVNKTDWTQHCQAALVNAFYSPTENSIQFPAAILQGQFYNTERPNYLNYGAVGFIIGHEITHGFDSIGRLFDKNGNVFNWWAAYAEKKFDNKAECIIKQYNTYKVNANQTLGENIADIGAAKISYNAYVSWLMKNGAAEPQVPGLNYTNRQMFWVGIANSWCDRSTKKQIKQQILHDEHSPSEFRVKGSLSNMPEFSQDFNCPLGSKMNPQVKCSIW